MFPSRAALTWTFAACAVVAAACGGCPAPPSGPVEPGPALPDGGGKIPKFDGGTVPSDGGPYYSGSWAGEACPAEAFLETEDAGIPDGAVPFGLCVALRTLSGTPTLNADVADSFHVSFESSGFGSQFDAVTDGGHYAVRAMRSQYESLKYHPNGIFPTHEGPVDFGSLNLVQDRVKDLFVKSWHLNGTLRFGGRIPRASTFPPDTSFGAAGMPPFQGVSTSHVNGSYDVSLIEGVFALGLAMPPESLGETQLVAYPVSPGLVFYGDTTLDIDIPTSQLSGELTIDGMPYPNRRDPGYDYQLEYYGPAGNTPVARTLHEGGRSEYFGRVPQGKYSVRLYSESVADKSFPSIVEGKELTSVDLSQDVNASFAFTTFSLEGALRVDGQPIKSVPNNDWTLYAFNYGHNGEPAYVTYYEVPMEQTTFTLRAFPGEYYLAVYLDEKFHPDMPHGWFTLDTNKKVVTDDKLPIDILTARFRANLRVDGALPPTDKMAGTLYFQGNTGTYARKVVADDKGSFEVRVPQGTYDVYFVIDSRAYPGYAVGPQLMVEDLDLTQPQQVDLAYDTVLVAGPLRVAGEVVKNTLVGSEVGLELRRQSDGIGFEWSNDGEGGPMYWLRVPRGDYTLNFKIEKDALEDTAWGTAPMGIKLWLTTQQ